MRQRALLVSLFVVLGIAALPGSPLAGNFNFECRSDRYVSVPVGQMHQFQAPLSAIPPGNDSVDVVFETHLPDTWFAQWCQFFTGVCYFSNERIGLVSGIADRLDIDIFPAAGTPGMGWVDITIRSVADPLDVARCTYTLFSGMPVPLVSYTVNSSDCTRWLSSGTYAEFYTPIRNNTFDMDTLLVRMFPNVPGDWFAQFCQESSGICFPEYGELAIWPSLTDNLHVQAFLGAAPSMGGLDFVIQSKRNPSVTQYAYYRIFLGSWPADLPPATVDATARTWAAPNPSTGPTSIVLRSPAGGTGELTIFGADGRIVRSFPHVDLAAGVTAVQWDGGDDRGETVGPGIYFYRFLVGGAAHRGTLVRTR
jgi:hypothetical protein